VKNSRKDVRAAKKAWEQGPVQQALSHQGERRERFQTASGIEVKPLYTPLDLDEAGFDYNRDVGFPGQYPFTRGKDPLGYRQNLWVTLQYSGFGDAEETNKRYHFLLDRGQTGISVALDLPTQLGYDSDHPLAEGEVGKVGVPIDSLQDVELLFAGIPLDRPRQVSTTANAIGPIWLAMLIVLAEKEGISLQNCKFRIQNDILKEYIARGTYIYPPKPSVSVATDAIAYCAEHYPHWLPLTACGYHMRDAGANAAQEIAFTIANAIAYIDDVIRKGIDPERFISNLAVHLAVGMDFLEEIAKFRAMRRLWARTFKERYSISNPDVLSFTTINYTAGSSLTAQQPLNNIIRVAIEALASALSGGQSIFTCSYDEAYCTPTEQAVKIALNTQHIIAHETGVTQTVDPLAGSYFVEHLTTKLETMAEEYLHKVDEMGGAIRAIDDGYFQREITKSAYEIQREIENGERVVVGVNQYVDEDEPAVEILKVDPVLERKQKDKLKKLKEERNQPEVREALKGVKRAAENGENLVPSLITAARAYVTVGEICDTLREVYGEYTAPSWLS